MDKIKRSRATNIHPIQLQRNRRTSIERGVVVVAVGCGRLTIVPATKKVPQIWPNPAHGGVSLIVAVLAGIGGLACLALAALWRHRA